MPLLFWDVALQCLVVCREMLGQCVCPIFRGPEGQEECYCRWMLLMYRDSVSGDGMTGKQTICYCGRVKFLMIRIISDSIKTLVSTFVT
jgi:hypothetical protein